MSATEEIEKYIEFAKYANEERIQLLEPSETEFPFFKLLTWTLYFIVFAISLAIQ